MNEAELRFKEWLEKNRYPYLYIEQSIDTFSTFFREELLKRPDFLIVLKHIGLIAVDVKDKEPRFEENNLKYYTLDEESEVKKYYNFETITRISVWFVFLNRSYNYELQFWIPLSKVLQSEIRLSSKNEKFRIISTDAGIIIHSNKDTLAKIFE